MSENPVPIRVPKFVRSIYSHNPFYLISACLFVYGLKVYFGTSSGATFTPGEAGYIDPWNLMLSLCGVTTLMAVTAFLIVRLGKVWEDARSIVLVLLLMFLAISVSFDEILNRASWDAINLLMFGLLFSVAVSELLLHGLRIRLNWQYRVPFYMFLVLFFAFPAWASPELSNELRDVVRWRVALFPCLAGLITLGLIPAVRQGRQACSNNGTPWSWPMFPWSVFAFLLVGVCFRSWTLSISLDTGSMKTSIQSMDSAFGPYLLIPFLLPVICVVLEIAIVERLRKLQNALMICAGVLVLIAIPGLSPNSHHVTYRSFVGELMMHGASPVFMTVIAVMCFFAYAWLRGVRSASIGFVASCFACVFVGPTTTSPVTASFQMEPMFALGPLLIVFGFLRRQPIFALGGTTLLAIAVGWQASESFGGIFQYWQTERDILIYRCLVVAHAVLYSVLLIDLFLDNSQSKLLRRWGAILIPILAAFSWIKTVRLNEVVELMRFGYLVFLASSCLLYALLTKERDFWHLGFINLGFLGVFLTWHGYAWFRQLRIADGVQPLIYGGACFAVAIVISLLKSGAFDRFIRRFKSDDALSSNVETLPSNGDS